MARPKKPEERRRIRDVAFNVFARKGLESTSFSDIAKEASVSKSLVQYYFPKKEQFVSDFIDRSLTITEEIIEEDLDYEFKHELAKLFAMGLAQFHFSINNKALDAMRMDILRDRGSTEVVVRYAIDWIFKHTTVFPLETQEEEDMAKKTIVYVIGGTFDSLYDCMLYDVDFDLDFLFFASTAIMKPYLTNPFGEAEAIKEALSPEWLDAALKKYNERLFVET
ncbi:MAG: TetR/AcrR family transcriptional regulator [Clostridia bacterium]|nr:TetR/AcrR family transcriptional regulator [Clostridia bacterium]